MIGVSIFGAYPMVGTESIKVWVGVPLELRITSAIWRQNKFQIDLEIMGHHGFCCRLSGGASSGHGLSQNLISQLQAHRHSLDLAGVDLSLLSDFIFDQIYPLPGSHRQTQGLLGEAWLTGSDVEAMATRNTTVSEFLGCVVSHPAALIGSQNGYSPFSGAETRVPPQIIGHLESGLPHFRSKGYLAVDGQSPIMMNEELNLSTGWVVTGKRGGLERQIREQAISESRPLIIVTRQEEAANAMRFVCPNKIIKPDKRQLGALREWMISQVNGSFCHEGEEAQV